MKFLPSILICLGLITPVETLVAQEGSVTSGEFGALIHVVMETELGSITIELYPDRAPKTVQNFLAYVEAGLFADGTFYRTVTSENQPNDSIKIAVIQGGANGSRRQEYLPPIPLESTEMTGLRHLDGTLSMARSGPDTGRAEFFVCVGDQLELDFAGKRNPDGQGFAAFGRVIEGMEVIHLIHQRAANNRQRLIEPVRILEVSVVSGSLSPHP